MLQGDRIYLTAVKGDQLSTLALDRHTGKTLWERPAPAPAKPVVDKRNSPASPSPAVEADGVYVFFQDFGLLAYDAAGKERWRVPLGPFNNIYGMGASPVLVGDLGGAVVRSEHGFVRHGGGQTHRQGTVANAASGSPERPRDADRVAGA
jgi:outer membrane protein assembly factor BamB